MKISLVILCISVIVLAVAVKQTTVSNKNTNKQAAAKAAALSNVKGNNNVLAVLQRMFPFMRAFSNNFLWRLLGLNLNKNKKGANKQKKGGKGTKGGKGGKGTKGKGKKEALSANPKEYAYYEDLWKNNKAKKLQECTCAGRTVDYKSLKTWDDETQANPGMYKGGKAKGYNIDRKLNAKVSLWVGQITCLEIDAIVNAANTSLLGGCCIDGAIHKGADGNANYQGKGLLKKENALLGGCGVGKAKTSYGYALPSHYVISTVGPKVGQKGAETQNEQDQLKNCYTNSLKEMKFNPYETIKSIALPGISTGKFGFNKDKAADIAVKAVRDYMEKNGGNIDRVVFVIYDGSNSKAYEQKIYREKLKRYFPA